MSQPDQAWIHKLIPRLEFPGSSGPGISGRFFFLLFVKCYCFFSYFRVTLYDVLDCLPASLQLLTREFYKASRKPGTRRNLEALALCLGNGFDLVWVE